MNKIDLQMQKLLVLKAPFWKRLSDTFIKNWIRQDSKAGKVQAFIPQTRRTKNGAQRYSDGYRKMKMNFMRRFTKGDAKMMSIKGKKELYFKNPKAKFGKGNYVKGISNVVSNSGTPNMMLTGQTVEGLEYKSSTPTSLTMSYNPKDADKLIWNEQMGRVMTTLSKENRERTVKMIEDELVRNISDWYKGKIIINIGG